MCWSLSDITHRIICIYTYVYIREKQLLAVHNMTQRKFIYIYSLKRIIYLYKNSLKSNNNFLYISFHKYKNDIWHCVRGTVSGKYTLYILEKIYWLSFIYKWAFYVVTKEMENFHRNVLPQLPDVCKAHIYLSVHSTHKTIWNEIMRKWGRSQSQPAATKTQHSAAGTARRIHITNTLNNIIEHSPHSQKHYYSNTWYIGCVWLYFFEKFSSLHYMCFSIFLAQLKMYT